MAECGGGFTSLHVRDVTQMAQNNLVNMAVVGCAGQGKSTLVNSLLLLGPDSERAEEGGVGKTTTTSVSSYKKVRDGAEVKIWDVPGLHDTAHVDQEKVIKELAEKAKNNLDFMLFCIAYHPGLRVSDGHRESIKFLTKHFGSEIWKNTCFVLTMVNTATPANRRLIPQMKSNVEEELKKALLDAGVPQDTVDAQHLTLAGYSTEKLWISENEEIDWNKQFFEECLCTINNNDKKITLIQARHGESIWEGLAVKVGVIAGIKAAVFVFAQKFFGGGASYAVGEAVGEVASYAIEKYLKTNNES